jgi:hypothetical protein
MAGERALAPPRSTYALAHRRHEISVMDASIGCVCTALLQSDGMHAFARIFTERDAGERNHPVFRFLCFVLFMPATKRGCQVC